MANITVSDLYINSKKMPTPALEGVVISREKIWSANTGRTAAGKMVGTVVAVKTTIKIKCCLRWGQPFRTGEIHRCNGRHRD